MVVYLPFSLEFISKHFFRNKADVKLMNMASVLLLLKSSSFVSRNYLTRNKCATHSIVFSAFSTLCIA